MANGYRTGTFGERLRWGAKIDLTVFRCKHCRIGVLRRDREGHLQRCQGHIENVRWHFVKADTFDDPKLDRWCPISDAAEA